MLRSEVSRKPPKLLLCRLASPENLLICASVLVALTMPAAEPEPNISEFGPRSISIDCTL